MTEAKIVQDFQTSFLLPGETNLTIFQGGHPSLAFEDNMLVVPN